MVDFFHECARFFDRRFFISLWGYAAFLAAVLIAAEIVEGRGLFMLFDRAILEHIVASRTHTLTAVMRVMTLFGNGVTVWLFTIVAASLLAAQRKSVVFTALVLSVAGASVVALALKQILVRPRPMMLPIVSETTFSFPSGHSSLSLAFYGILIYFLLRCTCGAWAKYGGIAACVAMIATVGFSRLYLGVHWPSDVVGGYVLTGVWLYLVTTQAEWITRHLSSAGRAMLS